MLVDGRIMGLMLRAKVHTGPDNAVAQKPEGMDDKQLVDGG